MLGRVVNSLCDVLLCGFSQFLNAVMHHCVYRRRAASAQVAKPNSSRAAGAGGSSNTMLKLYTDDSPGLRVYVVPQFVYLGLMTYPIVCYCRDPFIVLVLSLSFIASIFFLHISAKIIRAFTK